MARTSRTTAFAAAVHARTIRATATSFAGLRTTCVPRPLNVVAASRVRTALSMAIVDAPRTKRGLIQHKREAFWFYRFLSIVYDTIVNPFHWTEAMRDQSLLQAGLSDRSLTTVDVGGGTGFCTEGVLKYIDPENVTLLDQSPHQMAKAKAKKSLAGVTFVEGDAENLPFETGYADRYTSAGSIEYWPEPQRGIAEAYRVLKPGGMATIIGPVRATNAFSRFWCDLWMLFPMETEYRHWYESAGFTDIKVSYIGPDAYRGVREHGLIMGLTVTGTKPIDGPALPKVHLGEMLESRSTPLSLVERLLFLPRWMVGAVAGSYYVVLPLCIMLWAALFIKKPAASS
jgi:MPBQ/MSBQ methyltransferase